MKTLLPVAGEGYPTFMTNQAWADKNLSTFLGSWTELRHDTILYVKQVYAEMGGGGPPASVDDRGYVEPNPYLYAKLAALTKMTKDGLDGRGLLSDKNRDNLSIDKKQFIKCYIKNKKRSDNFHLLTLFFLSFNLTQRMVFMKFLKKHTNFVIIKIKSF